MAQTISTTKKMFSDQEMQDQVEEASKAGIRENPLCPHYEFFGHIICTLASCVFTLGALAAVYFMFHLKKTWFSSLHHLLYSSRWHELLGISICDD
jgi:hypothetical protein